MQTFITWPSYFFLLFSLLSNSFSYANTEEKKHLYFLRKRKNLTIYHKVIKVFIPWFHFRTDAFFLFFQFRYIFQDQSKHIKNWKYIYIWKRYQHKFFYIFKLKQMYLNWQYVILLYLILHFVSLFRTWILLCVHIYSLCGYKFFFVHFLSIIYICCIDMDNWECLNYDFFGGMCTECRARLFGFAVFLFIFNQQF